MNELAYLYKLTAQTDLTDAIEVSNLKRTAGAVTTCARACGRMTDDEASDFFHTLRGLDRTTEAKNEQ